MPSRCDTRVGPLVAEVHAINVVLVVCDTLRADHVGCLGGRLPTTPWLDRCAASGLLFPRASSPHIPTQPAHATLFSGADAFAHRVVAHGGRTRPPDDLPWLTTLLAAHGVFTAAADNLGGFMERGMGEYASYAIAASEDGYWRKSEAVLDAVGRVLPHVRRQAEAGRPTFTFVHFWDPHTPYCPPPPFDGLFYDGDPRAESGRGMDAAWAFSPFADYFAGWMPGVTDREYPRAQYAACVRSLDVAVQRLFMMLGAARLLDDAFVILIADHGELLGEHGIWFDHHGLYDGNVHVPVLLWGPGRVPRGGTADMPVSLLDIAPTVAAALGVAPPAEWAGADLLALGTGVARRPESPLYCTECTWMKKRAWRSGRYKLISSLEPDFHGFADLELYDVEADPGETSNLAEVRPRLASDLLSALEAHVAERERASGLPDPLRGEPVSSRRIGAPAGPPGGGVPTGGVVRAPSAAVADDERERVSRRLERLGY